MYLLYVHLKWNDSPRTIEFTRIELLEPAQLARVFVLDCRRLLYTIVTLGTIHSPSPSSLLLPVLHVIQDQLGTLIRRMLTS